MLKVITIALTEKMIRQIDEALISGDFGSRSEFFRIIIRSWFREPDQGARANHSSLAAKRDQHNQPDPDDQIDVSEVNLEYGVPPELVKKFAEKAKLLNK